MPTNLRSAAILVAQSVKQRTNDVCYSCNEIKQSLPVQEPINILELSPSNMLLKEIQADLGGIHVSFKIHATS